MRCGALLRRRWHQLLLGPPAQPQLQLGAARRAASSAAASDDGGNEVINAATQQPPTSDSWMVFQTPAVKNLWALRRDREEQRRAAERALTMGLKETGGPSRQESEQEHKLLPAPTTLVPKRPGASRQTLHYAFKEDAVLRASYMNPWGMLRLGKLFEDLDALAGNVAFLHAESEQLHTRSQVLVTASIDGIKLRRPISLDEDLHVSASVEYVGTSSMDIVIEALSNGERMISAHTTFVARDAVSAKAVPLNPLLVETPEEQRIFEDRREHNAKRKSSERTAKRRYWLDSFLESADEAVAAHVTQWVQSQLERCQAKASFPSLTLGSHYVPMERTRLRNTMVCQPQQRNVYGRIFGGYLVRRAFEIAFATAYTFGGGRPTLREV